MRSEVPPVIYLYVAAALISWAVAFRAWRMRPARGAFLWAMVMVATGIWAAGAGLFAMSVVPAAGFAVQIIQYVGIMLTVYFYGAFALAYSQFDRFLTRQTYILMAIVPLVCYLIMATSPLHALFSTFALETESGILYLALYPGPVFWFWTGYSYLIILFGAVLLIISALRFSHLYRGQTVLLILASLGPIVLNTLFLVFRVRIVGPFSPVSWFFAVVGALMLLAIERYGFLNVVPVAHHRIFSSVRSGVIVLDELGRIVDINPAAQEIAGVESADVLGRPMLEALPAYQDQILRFRDVQEIKTEIAVRDQYYELQLMPLTNHRGRRVGRIVMLYDITDQKHIQDELDAYAHMVAHDLKGPVGVTQGWGNVLLANYEHMTDDQRRQRIAAIVDNTNTVLSIIDNLLLLASVRRQDQVINAYLEMDMIVDRVVSRLTPQLEAAEAHIELPESWLAARGHGPWVEEIWVNYVGNAIKYGGSPPRIVLGSESVDGDQVRFFVRDNGSGVAAKDQAQLFDGFSRLEQHANIEGHGIGLSIVESIARKLGGTVGVDSTPGEGSTFYFTLPAYQSPGRGVPHVSQQG